MPHFPTAGKKAGPQKKVPEISEFDGWFLLGDEKRIPVQKKSARFLFPEKKEKRKKSRSMPRQEYLQHFPFYILCQRWKEETIGAKRGKEEGTIEGENRPWCTNSPKKSN